MKVCLDPRSKADEVTYKDQSFKKGDVVEVTNDDWKVMKGRKYKGRRLWIEAKYAKDIDSTNEAPPSRKRMAKAEKSLPEAPPSRKRKQKTKVKSQVPPSRKREAEVEVEESAEDKTTTDTKES